MDYERRDLKAGKEHTVHKKQAAVQDSKDADPFSTSSGQIYLSGVPISITGSSTGSDKTVYDYVTISTTWLAGGIPSLKPGNNAVFTFSEPHSTSSTGSSSSGPTSSAPSSINTSPTTGISSSSASSTQSTTRSTASSSTSSSASFRHVEADVAFGTGASSATNVGAYKGWATCAPNSASSGQLSCTATSAPKGKSIAGVAAAAGILGALFLITLGALFFMMRRNRRGGAKTNKDVAMGAIPAYNRTQDNNKIQMLEQELADRDEKLMAVQGSALKASNRVQSLDDRAVHSRFEYIAQELKDWAITHFPGAITRVELAPDLRQAMNKRVRNIDGLLEQRRTKAMAIRAIAVYFLQQAFQDGEFVADGGMRSLGKMMESGSSAVDFNRWRSSTFVMLDRGSTRHERSVPIDTVTRRIEAAMEPLAQVAPSRERYQYLRGIVESVSQLAWDLGKQPARFKWMDEVAETPFRCQTMDDVLQEHETFQDGSGHFSNPLDGRPIQAVIFPAVIKYGNELGEAYDQMTVVVKAKVLV